MRETLPTPPSGDDVAHSVFPEYRINLQDSETEQRGLDLEAW